MYLRVKHQYSQCVILENVFMVPSGNRSVFNRADMEGVAPKRKC